MGRAKKREAPIKVLFLKEGCNVFAYFPELPGNGNGRTRACYSHHGQHSFCDTAYAESCQEAQEEEFALLKRELRSMGYVLNIVHRNF